MSLMRPPMNQKIFITEYELDENGEVKRDEYRKPIKLEDVEHPARTRRAEELIEKPGGEIRTSNVTLYVDPEVKAYTGQSIKYTMPGDDEIHEGEVLGISDATNIPGTVIYYKVLKVDGK